MPKVQKKKINNLNDIVEKVHKKVDANKSQVKEIISESLKEVVNALRKGESVNFIGYFSFSTRRQAPKEMIMRFGKNKGKKIKIAAKTVPVIKPTAALKKRIAE